MTGVFVITLMASRSGVSFSRYEPLDYHRIQDYCSQQALNVGRDGQDSYLLDSTPISLEKALPIITVRRKKGTEAWVQIPLQR